MADDRLTASLDEADWSLLREHAERGVVILVAPDLDLLEVGRAVAADDASRVQAWIAGGQLGKPTAEQHRAWDETPSKRFATLVLRPYALIQDRLPN